MRRGGGASAQKLGELNYEGAYFASYMLPVTRIPGHFLNSGVG